MQVIVATKSRGSREDSIRKEISWNDSSDRKWLMNHLHHCMMNNKLVTLCPLAVTHG